MRVIALVCENGLGHLRRVHGILSRAMDLEPRLHAVVVASEWQIGRLGLRDTEACRQGRLTFVPAGLSGTVRWSNRASDYEDGRLGYQPERFAALDLHEYDLVLSDNLVEPLQHARDAVLSGSFLWAEVLGEAFPSSAAVADFAARERALLEAADPAMLCVEGFASPWVAGLRHAVPCQLMCEAPRDADAILQDRRTGKIAVLSGGTRSAEAELEACVRELAAHSDCRFAVSDAMRARLHDLDHDGRVEAFAFGSEDFAAVDAVLARPGMGTVQDTVAAGAPLLCCFEDNQPELTHVASCVTRYGFGADVRGLRGPRLLEIIEEMRSAEWRRAYVERRAGLGVGGLAQAARWLLGRLNTGNLG